MKNEVFFRAMSEIDDDLIVMAQSAPVISRRTVLRRLGGIAACFVLVCTALVFLLSGRGADIRLYGEKLSSHPTAVDVPTPFPEDNARAITNTLILPFEVTSHGDITASVSDGAISAISDDGETVCSGRSIETTSPVSLEWTLNTPDTGKTYTFSVNGVDFTLAFDSVSESWNIKK